MVAWESESLNAIAKAEHGLMSLDEGAESLEAVKKHLTASKCPCPSALHATSSNDGGSAAPFGAVIYWAARWRSVEGATPKVASMFTPSVRQRPPMSAK